MPRLLVTAAAVLAGAFVLRCLEGCSAWVAAALVCAAAAPVTAYWLDLRGPGAVRPRRGGSGERASSLARAVRIALFDGRAGPISVPCSA